MAHPMPRMLNHRPHPLSFFALYLFTTANLTAFHAEARPLEGILARPGAACQTETLASWTPQERWIWDQVCIGQIADLAVKDGRPNDPRKPGDWPLSRIVRPHFLETILLHEPFRSALTRNGVQIVGAWFTEPVNLSNSSLSHQLSLAYCRFESNVAFDRVRTGQVLSVTGSVFTNPLTMDSLQAESNLDMRDSEFADVILRNAKVGGQLQMTRSGFTGMLDMDGLRVDGNLLMHKRTKFFADVILRNAKVAGDLGMDGSEFTGMLDMGGLRVEGNLFMREDAKFFADVILRNAEVGGDLLMDSSHFHSKLDMNQLQVVSGLFMQKARVSAPMSLLFGRVGKNLNVREATLLSLDLSGTAIGGELRLPGARWQNGGELKLRNTQVGSLQDSKNAWPEKVELSGFTYAHLGGVAQERGTEMANRDSSWFIWWLKKQEPYSPQPYQQLASILRNAGHSEKARNVLYASKERELREARGMGRIAWLLIQRVLIGYGYYPEYAGAWSLAAIAVGVIVLWKTGQGAAHGMPYGIVYSVDMLLPIIRLREYHYEKIDLRGFARYYFYVHKLAGYVLGSFLIAALAGLVK